MDWGNTKKNIVCFSIVATKTGYSTILTNYKRSKGNCW